MNYVASAVRRTAAVPVDALRLLARHWAGLLTDTFTPGPGLATIRVLGGQFERYPELPAEMDALKARGTDLYPLLYEDIRNLLH